MDSQQINIGVNVISGDATKALDDISKKVADIEKPFKSLKAQYREAQAEVARLGELYGETSVEALKAAKSAAQLKDQIGDAAKLTESFDPDKKFVALTGTLKGVIGSFELATGAQALFGDKSEELEETLNKVQGAMALSRSIDDLLEAKKAFGILTAQVKNSELAIAAYNFIQKGSLKSTMLTTAATEANVVATEAQTGATIATTVATNGASVAMKVFRGALIATGIGAIIVLIGTLVANFDKLVSWVMKAVDWFKGLSGTMKNIISVAFPLIGVIRGIGAALEAMGVIDSDAEKQMKANAEARKKRDEEMAKAALKNKDDIISKYDFEIAKAEAAGKDTYELEKLKQTAVLETLRVYYKAMEGIIKSGKATEEQIQEWNANIKAIDDIKKEIVINDIKRDTELKRRKEEDAKKEVEDSKKKRDQGIKDNKKRLEDAKKERERIEKINKESDDLITRNRLASIKDEFTRKQQEIQISRQKEIDEQLDLLNKKEINQKQYEERKLQIDQYYTTQQNNLLEEKKKADDDKAKQEIQTQEQKNKELLDLQNQLKDATLQNDLDKIEFNKKKIESELVDNKAKYDKLREIEDQEYNKKVEIEKQRYLEEIQRAGENADLIKQIERERDQKLIEMSKDHTAAKKELNIKETESEWAKVDAIMGASSALMGALGQDTAAGKALAVAEAVINTYKAASQVFARPAPGPPPVSLATKIASMVSALATGFKTVKSITSTKVPGAGGGGGVSAPSMGAGGGPQFSAPQMFGIGGQQIKDYSKDMKDQKVIVTEQDITRTQSKVNTIRKASILGG